MRQRQRSDRARRWRERRAASSPAATGSAADAVARTELQRALLDAVLRLREPYRRTVTRRFYDGASAAAIARAEQVPESTVRNRLHRGLGMLRAELTERLGGDPRLTALLPLTLAPPSGTAGGPSLTFAIGSLVMSQTAKLVAAAGFLALALGVGVWTASPGTPDPAVRNVPGAGPVSAPAPDRSRTEEPARVALPLDPVPPDRPVPGGEEAPAPPPPAGTLEVIASRGGIPVTSGWLHVRPRGDEHYLPRDPWTVSDMRRAALDGEGVARVVGLEPGRYALGVELRPGDLRQQFVTLTNREGKRVLIELGSAALSGHIYRDDGTPVSGARIQVSGPGWQGPNAIAWTGRDGAFRVEGLRAGVAGVGVSLSGAWHDIDEMLKIELHPGENVWDHGRPAGLPTWRGVVRTRTGEPVFGTGPLTLHRDGGGYRAIRYGADGSFSVQLPAGTWAVDLGLPGYGGHRFRSSIEVGERDLDQDLTVPGATLLVTVTRAGTGARPSAAELRARHCYARSIGRTDPGAGRSAHVADEGTVRIYGVTPGRWHVGCNGADVVEVVLGRADLELRVPLVLR